MRKVIKVAFVDGYSPRDIEWLRELLGDKFTFVLEQNNPDYVFYSVFGCEHIKYDCIRIFYTAENCRADFNFCDYAITFDYLEYEDRHFRYPFYLRDYDFSKLESSKECDRVQFDRKFCSFVVSNGKADELRSKVFEALNSYKRVDSAGLYKNNVGFYVKDKIAFLREYKFNICFENSYTNGYVTEKIIHAKAANTIPIYWGGISPQSSTSSKNGGGVQESSSMSKYVISDKFNKKAFINLADYESIEKMVEFIKYLDRNESAYLAMLKEPLIVESNEHKATFDKALSEFLTNIFSKDIASASRRGFGQWRLNIESRYKKLMRLRNAMIKITDIYRKVIFLEQFKRLKRTLLCKKR